MVMFPVFWHLNMMETGWKMGQFWFWPWVVQKDLHLRHPLERVFLLQPNNQGFDTRECETCEIYWNFHWSGPTISEHDATPGWKCIWEEVMENVEFLGRHCSCVGSWTTIFRSTIFCKCDVHSWKCVVKYWPYPYAPNMEYWRLQYHKNKTT